LSSRDLDEEDYLEAVKELLQDYPRVKRKTTHILRGVMCSAGKEMIRLRPNGWVARCIFDDEPFAHLDDPDFALPTEPQRCTVRFCSDFGLKYALLTPHQEAFVAGLEALRIALYDEATTHFLHVLELGGHRGGALNNLAVAAHRSGDPAAALAYLRQAVAADGAHPLLRDNLARLQADSRCRLSICLEVNRPDPA